MEKPTKKPFKIVQAPSDSPLYGQAWLGTGSSVANLKPSSPSTEPEPQKLTRADLSPWLVELLEDMIKGDPEENELPMTEEEALMWLEAAQCGIGTGAGAFVRDAKADEAT